MTGYISAVPAINTGSSFQFVRTGIERALSVDAFSCTRFLSSLLRIGPFTSPPPGNRHQHHYHHHLHLPLSIISVHLHDKLKACSYLGCHRVSIWRPQLRTQCSESRSFLQHSLVSHRLHALSRDSSFNESKNLSGISNQPFKQFISQSLVHWFGVTFSLELTQSNLKLLREKKVSSQTFSGLHHLLIKVSFLVVESIEGTQSLC